MIQASAAIKISDRDNVAVALEEIKTGDTIFDIAAKETIPAGHKMALSLIAPGESVIKYGHPIGCVTCEIQPGAHVHTHNLKTNLSGIEEYSYNASATEARETPPERTFMGYKRPDGQVGIRNEIWIINTVGCVNKIAEKIAADATNHRKSRHKNKNIDGIYTFVHPYGCSQLGDDHSFTQKILAGMVKHPNAGGVLVLGLGCENNLISDFKEILGDYDPQRVKFLNTQDVKDEVAEGLKIIGELVEYASAFKRESIPISRLIFGLKCGGSDGLSGITANALVGSLADAVTAHGGTCILTEVPEMFGAEALLMERSADRAIFDKTVKLINDFKGYFIRHGQEIYENPSPGNKEGGITTLEEKSLGCTQKGGNSQVMDVLDYGETVKKSGINLLQGPGNDIVAVTNLMAAGVHIILFTTGRGTPLGAPVPTVKISSNTALAKSKPHWIDYNAGLLVSHNFSLSELTEGLLDYVIDVAEGELTQNEVNGYREISIFKDGVTL
ncbi:MAG: altronate dehydratase family protein [Defluviitaleaceae bacterium]|nr:altronate dehydratase family protein [Defluviitaleaceae bacterium]